MIFPLAPKVTDPLAIVPCAGKFNNQQSFPLVTVKGEFRHVFPTTWPEIKAVQKMTHRVDKFAPAGQGGILITEEAFQNLTGRGDR